MGHLKMVCQNRGKSEHFPSTSRGVPVLVGCYAKDGLVRMCSHQVGELSSLCGSHQSGNAEFYTVWTAMWPLGAAGGCADTVLPFLASFVPHVVWNMNESHYSDCTRVRFSKSFVDALPPPASAFFSPAWDILDYFLYQISVSHCVRGSFSQIMTFASWSP